MIKASVVLDSVAPCAKRLTTIEVTYHRFIHAELLTHRALSRNSASSRAIPVAAMLARIAETPAVPVHWGRKQKGMRADREVGAVAQRCAKAIWSAHRSVSLASAYLLDKLGVHKQVANRLTEAHSHITVLISATEWANFIHLRKDIGAQPEMRQLGDAIECALYSSAPVRRENHLPYVTGYDEVELVDDGLSLDDLRWISVGRCAAISYLTHHRRDHLKDLARGQRMVMHGHMSPTEHVARALTEPSQSGNFIGWGQLRKTIANEHDPLGDAS